jgi:hypothetical protein
MASSVKTAVGGVYYTEAIINVKALQYCVIAFLKYQIDE